VCISSDLIRQLPVLQGISQIWFGSDSSEPKSVFHPAKYPLAFCHCIFCPDEFSHKGQCWALSFFMRSAGIIQMTLSKSISSQRTSINLDLDTMHKINKCNANLFYRFNWWKLDGRSYRAWCYFPIQKLENIRPNKSSELNWPVISARWFWASLKSSATNSPARLVCSCFKALST